MWQNKGWLYKQLLPIRVQTAWNRQMNFPPHGQRTQIQGAFGRFQRFMENTAIMHISSHIYKRCRQAYTGDTSEENPISGHLTGLMISFTWHDAEKNRNPCLPPLSVLPFMTHDEAGDLLKSSRGGREVWKNEARVTYEILYVLVFWQLHVFESHMQHITPIKLVNKLYGNKCVCRRTVSKCAVNPEVQVRAARQKWP